MRVQFHSALALGALLSSSACVDVDEPIDEDQPGEVTPLRDQRHELFGVYEVGEAWQKPLLKVCWMPDVYDDPDPNIVALRSAGRAAVIREWDRVSGIRIAGSWPRCDLDSLSPMDIRIGREEGGAAGHSAIGTNALSKPADEPTMGLTFELDVLGGCRGTPGELCGNFGPEALDPTLQASFELIIVHEFGHALGLRHEQAHPDSTCGYTEDLSGDGFNGAPIWSFDAYSVMSYCSGSSKLSAGDIRAINTLYPGVVGLFAAEDLASAPLRVGPGYYTSTQIPTLGQISGIVVPPGFRVRLCNNDNFDPCDYVESSQRTLGAKYNNRITSIQIVPWVIGASRVGYRGTTERFGLGAHDASGFLALADNAMRSAFVPLTRAATVCAYANGGAPCVGPYIGGTSPTVGVSFPATVSGNVSYVAVDPRVVTYSDPTAFIAPDYALSPGTYKASTHPWVTGVRSLAIAGLDVRACTEEGTPFSPGGGDCRTYTQSVDLAAAGHTSLKYLKVSVPVVTAP